jgi:hypothetical protein
MERRDRDGVLLFLEVYSVMKKLRRVRDTV